ncbi:MAG: hypothetical protein WAO76_09610 [Georgfuchsia sp.]
MTRESFDSQVSSSVQPGLINTEPALAPGVEDDADAHPSLSRREHLPHQLAAGGPARWASHYKVMKAGAMANVLLTDAT